VLFMERIVSREDIGFRGRVLKQGSMSRMGTNGSQSAVCQNRLRGAIGTG